MDALVSSIFQALALVNMASSHPSPALYFHDIFRELALRYMYGLHSVLRRSHLCEVVYTNVRYDQLKLLHRPIFGQIINVIWQEYWGLSLGPHTCHTMLHLMPQPYFTSYFGTRSHEVAQAGFEVLILLPQFLHC